MRIRKAIYRSTAEEGRALLARAPEVQVAMVGEDGRPILRTLNAVVEDGVIAFHGAPAGEKMEGVGGPAVVAAHETVASIPSYFVDPLRACPATTYYLSAQAHGVAREVTDPVRKARLLQAMMEKYQPEGGHVPLAADAKLYRKPIAGLLVFEVPLDDVACKEKLGQNRTVADRHRVLTGLWRRGGPGDVRAIGIVLSRSPELPPPAFLVPPPHVASAVARLQVWLDDDEWDEAVALVAGAYWLEGVPRETVARAMRASTAVAAARDRDGRLVAFARAVSDGRCAWIYDVVVAEDVRSTGVGSVVMQLLLEHPMVRDVRHVRLSTRDAEAFYRRLGFVQLDEAPRHAWRSIEMIRAAARSGAASPPAGSEAAAEPEAVRAAADERSHGRDAGLR